MATVMATGMVMVTAKNRQNKRFYTYAASALGIFGAFAASAAERELKIEPSITVRGEFHDRRAVIETAKWVAEIDPVLAVKMATGDSSLSLRYSPRILFTDLPGERSEVVQSLATQGTISFAAKRLQFGVNALIGEQARDPLSPLLTTSSLPFGERLRSHSIGANFVARDHVTAGILGEVRGSYQFSDSTVINRDETLPERLTPSSRTWRVSADLKPSTRRPPLGLFAGVEYGRRTATSQANDAESYKGFLGADFNHSSQFGWGVRAGYEQADFVSNGQDLRGAYVDLVSEWRPNQRVEAKALVGAHYYGIGYELNGKFRGARTALEVTARRAVSTAQEQILFPATDTPLTLLDRFLLGSITDPAARATEVQRLARVLGIPDTVPESRFFFADRSALEEFVRVSGVYSLPRWTFNGFAQYRETIPSASEVGSLRADALKPTSEWQAGLGTAYRLATDMTLRAEFATERARTKDDDRRLSRVRSNVTLSKQWSRAISTGATVFYDRVRSDNVRAEYDDRGLGAFVRYQFN
jgi:uncharacterized protein (PEP-CTERM system associated)